MAIAQKRAGTGAQPRAETVRSRAAMGIFGAPGPGGGAVSGLAVLGHTVAFELDGGVYLASIGLPPARSIAFAVMLSCVAPGVLAELPSFSDPATIDDVYAPFVENGKPTTAESDCWLVGGRVRAGKYTSAIKIRGGGGAGEHLWVVPGAGQVKEKAKGDKSQLVLTSLMEQGALIEESCCQRGRARAEG